MRNLHDRRQETLFRSLTRHENPSQTLTLVANQVASEGGFEVTFPILESVNPTEHKVESIRSLFFHHGQVGIGEKYI